MHKLTASVFLSVISLCVILPFLAGYAAAECPTADISGDCQVGMTDLLILADNWLQTGAVVHPDLTAKWRLDESDSEIAFDDVNGYAGQLYGDPQWMPAEGNNDGALFFDGTDDYVLTDFAGITGGASRTCSAWIETNGSAANMVIMQWGTVAKGEQWLFGIFSTGELTIFSGGAYIKTTAAVTDGQWHHVAAVLDSDGTPDISEVGLFIDGEPAQTVSNPFPVETADGSMTIGAVIVNASPEAVFLGKLDNVEVYTDALTFTDVRRLYETGSATRSNPDMTADNQVGYEDYRFLSAQWSHQSPEVVISEFMASNDSDNPPVTDEGQIRDGNGDSSDWIELYNETNSDIDLSGWALSDDAGDPFQWRFPAGTILPGESYLIVFASGRSNDEYPYSDPAGYLHTNFNLSASGEYLSLVRPDGTAVCVYDSVEGGFPEQQPNISYGLMYGEESYFALPTPGAPNRGQFEGFVDAPDFSHERGFYDTSFALSLSCTTDGATIRYTLDGSDPSWSNGVTYSGPISIPVSTTTTSRCVRAAAFKPGYASSRIKTKTYLLKATDSMKGLPAVCLTGSPTRTFYNPSGIMAIVGGAWGGNGWYKVNTTDYNNVLGHGMDFERPVSMEYVNPFNGEEFQEDCGIRVHGSAWMRPRYTLPTSGVWSGTNKYSFRLYFRGDYGKAELDYPILPAFPEVETMDTVVLRAGHNDQTNPFVRDEMIRRLQYFAGSHASLGGFVNLFVNGSYKGYYNVCERLDEDFFQKYYNSSLEWDVVGWIQPDNILEARDGDMEAFNTFIDYAITNNLSDPVHYRQVTRQLDLVQFIDYIIVQCWGGNWDWPQNNWTAAAERSPDRLWRFYVWDAEGAMDNDLYRDRFSKLLSSDGDRSHLSRLFKALYANEDFRIAFADRVQKHFYEEGGTMKPAFLNTVFSQLTDEVQGVIPYISSYISATYIPGRESVFMNQCTSRDLFTFQGPQILFEGSVVGPESAGREGDLLSFQNAAGQSGDIYFTLDGSDPRVSLGERMTTVTLVDENAPKRVLVPTGNIGTNWRSQVNYNDSGWNAGLPADLSKTGGVGYEIDAVGNKAYISYDIRGEMYNQRTTAYIRIPFTVDAQELATWNTLTLSMRYDDGFVVYINGTEVCRRSFNGTPAWDSSATSQHENNSLEEINLNSYLHTLKAGDNLLAIHGLNISTGSSDFVVSPILKAGRSIGSNGISNTAQRYTTPVALDRTVRVKARTLNGSTWSALRETDVTIGFAAQALRISEVMFNPAADPNEEFIELVNTGTDTINMKGIRFSKGIDYAFDDLSLAGGAYLLLVRNLSVFENRYGAGLPVWGQYAGSLDNAGETLKLEDMLGNTVQRLDFKDSWYTLTDGGGFSLTAVDPSYDRTADIVGGYAARWTFDEPTGTAVADSSGAHPGSIHNMQNTTRVPGQVYKALRFDGTDDYVSVPGYTGITGTAARTCSAWVRASAGGYKVILNWGLESTQHWLLGIYPDGQFGVYLATGNEIKSGISVADGRWHHVAAVLYDDGSPSLDEIQLYIDGARINGVFTSTLPVNTPAGSNVTLGARLMNGQMGVFFNGLMDDVRIYDRALAPQEIASIADGINWSQKDPWRPSAIYGGTPGRAETAQEQLPLPGSVVINEVLSHSHGASPDWIELYNTTDQSIAIGGWFLSDSCATDADCKKFQIPAGVILTPSNPYYVVEESRFNNASDPACRIPFALSEGGETVYLQSAIGETLTGYLTQEEFDAAESNVSFGRFQKSSGSYNFVPMSVQTKGAANAYPKVGPLIMTEIMYNPGSATADKDCEYIELTNISAQPVRTASYVSTYTGPSAYYEEWIGWRFDDGIEYEFPADLLIDAGQKVLLVKDLDAFSSKYAAPDGTVILEWTDGSLDNAGEKLQLSMPGDQEYQEQRYYIRRDRVNYDDQGEWPTAADGTGKSLTHIRPAQAGANYTNDAANWAAEDPTPGW